MRVLVVGASGQVGAALVRQLTARGDVVVGTHRVPGPTTVTLDIADHAGLRARVEESGADAVFLTAAFTHVDGCEDDPPRAFALNRDAPATAAAAAARRRAAFVFYSTDYVFDGAAGPYAEDDPVRPLSVYGRSKLEGERAVLAAHPDALVIRTTVAYGVDPKQINFVYQVLRRARAGERMPIPADQRSTPTYVEDLAAGSIALVDKRQSGVFHVAGPEMLDRYAFAREICRVFGVDPGGLEPVTTAVLTQKAPRPLVTGLRADRAAAVGVVVRPPAEGLAALRAAIEGPRG